MLKNFVTPNDEGIIAESDSRSIQNAIDEAVRLDLRKVVIPRINQRTGKALWETDEAIILPSDIEIVLDNCYIRQADGSMDNVFRNFDDDAMRKTLAEEHRNITIRGEGNAVIDGGVHNGLTQQNSMKNGMPHVEKNNLIRLHNLRGFKLQNFTLMNQRWWAVNLNYVEEGIISGVRIECSNAQHNQDGIDLRAGCNNIILENLVGHAGDDFVALTGFLSPYANEKYGVEGKSCDIHDVVIKNIVATSAECTVVALRNQDGLKLYNVTIDGIHDTISSEQAANKNPSFVFNFDLNSYKSPKSPYATIRIGQGGYATLRENALGDTYGIHVTNVHSRVNSAILLNQTLKDSYFGNIYADGGVERVVTTKSCRNHQEWGCDMENVVFENVFYKPANGTEAVAFDFDINGRERKMDNVIIRNAFIADSGVAVDMKHRGALNISGLYAKDAKNKIKCQGDATVFLDGEKI